MGLHGDADQRVPPPAVDEGLGGLESLFQGAVAGGGKIEENLTDHGPHAGPAGRLGHGILEKVHVAEARGARQDHFGTGQGRPGGDLRPVEGCLGRKDVVVEPGHQGQVVGKAPEAGHGRVGVGVDQPGHDDAAAGIFGAADPPALEVAGFADGGDPVPEDGHGAAGDRGVVCIHGQHKAV